MFTWIFEYEYEYEHEYEYEYKCEYEYENAEADVFDKQWVRLLWDCYFKVGVDKFLVKCQSAGFWIHIMSY